MGDRGAVSSPHREQRLDPRLVEHRRAPDHETHLELVRRFELDPGELAHHPVHGKPDPARHAHDDLVAAAGVGDEAAAFQLGELRFVRGAADEPAVAGGTETGHVGAQAVLRDGPATRGHAARRPPCPHCDRHRGAGTPHHEQTAPQQRELGGKPVGVGHRERHLRDERAGEHRQPHAEQPARDPTRPVERDELLGIVDVVSAFEPVRQRGGVDAGALLRTRDLARLLRTRDLARLPRTRDVARLPRTRDLARLRHQRAVLDADGLGAIPRREREIERAADGPAACTQRPGRALAAGEGGVA